MYLDKDRLYTEEEPVKNEKTKKPTSILARFFFVLFIVFLSIVGFLFGDSQGAFGTVGFFLLCVILYKVLTKN